MNATIKRYGTSEHGEEGHLNTFIRDQESPVTDYGRNYRVVAFLPDCEGLYCRVDHKHGERMPTDREVLKAAIKTQGIRGKWVLSKIEGWSCNQHTDFFFKREA